MVYDVLSDDLYSGDDDSPKKKRSSKTRNSGNSDSSNFNFNFKYLHIGVILILMLILIVFLFKNITFNFNTEEEVEKITMVGSLSDFNINYSGDVELYSAEFFLHTNKGEFNSEKLDISITNFNGSIYFANSSLIFNGTSDNIIFGKNNLILNGENFILSSIKKTNLDIYLENITFNFDEGVIKIGTELKHEFENTSIELVNFNSSLIYDGTFSITGVCDSLELETFKPNLKILYSSTNN